MSYKPSESQSQSTSGFLQKSFKILNFSQQKPVFWLVILIFLLTSALGFVVGNTLVLNTIDGDISPKFIANSDEEFSYLVLETDNLSSPNPELISIWIVHLKSGRETRLGFTPVVTIEMTDSNYYELLSQFSLTNSNIPSQSFFNQVSRNGIKYDGFVIIDQISASVFMSWFLDEEKKQEIDLTDHSMSAYGKNLRGLCGSLSIPFSRGDIDFPWSQIYPGHFQTSIQFTQVLENINFFTNTPSPGCEMVPLK